MKKNYYQQKQHPMMTFAEFVVPVYVVFWMWLLLFVFEDPRQLTDYSADYVVPSYGLVVNTDDGADDALADIAGLIKNWTKKNLEQNFDLQFIILLKMFTKFQFFIFLSITDQLKYQNYKIFFRSFKVKDYAQTMNFTNADEVADHVYFTDDKRRKEPYIAGAVELVPGNATEDVSVNAYFNATLAVGGYLDHDATDGGRWEMALSNKNLANKIFEKNVKNQ